MQQLWSDYENKNYQKITSVTILKTKNATIRHEQDFVRIILDTYPYGACAKIRSRRIFQALKQEIKIDHILEGLFIGANFFLVVAVLAAFRFCATFKFRSIGNHPQPRYRHAWRPQVSGRV
ncbi:hypothetical protein [Candidatus Spongiihabitans sp.]|uniref:hypothetical protein n=1 Tax=Candidatus Spongiihabitans sp. TaxID=3101308 RepID=UPI003C6FEA39